MRKMRLRPGPLAGFFRSGEGMGKRKGREKEKRKGRGLRTAPRHIPGYAYA